MEVGHGGLDIGATQELLDLTDVHAVDQQVRGEAVVPRVFHRAGRYCQLLFPSSAAYSILWP